MRLVTRRRLLLGGGAALGLAGVRAAADPPPVRLVVVVANGGWDPTFHLDPKPGLVDGPYPDLDPDDPRDVEIVREYGEFRVTTNEARRPSIQEFFDQYADRAAVVNGLWVGSQSHWQGLLRVLTGGTSEELPDVATIAGVELGAGLPLASIDLSGLSRMGPYASMCARSGVRGQLAALLDPDQRSQLAEGVARPDFRPSARDRAAIDAWLAGRDLGDTLDPQRAEWGRFRQEARDRAARLRAVPKLADALPDGRRTDFPDDVDLAVELLARDACHSIVLDTEQGWDTHIGAIDQHPATTRTFSGLTKLADRLREEGLFDRTLVAVISEMGRAPVRNADGGSEHWPYTSALLFGADVAGGRRVGWTDDALVGDGGPDGGPVRYDQLAAGLLEAVGVDPGRWLPGVAPLRTFRS